MRLGNVLSFRKCCVGLTVIVVCRAAVPAPMSAADEIPASAQAGERIPVVFGDPPQTARPIGKFDPGEAALTPQHAGQHTTLFGRLEDTGALNLFHAFWYDGSRIARRRFYVRERVYKRPHAAMWASIDATITHVDARSNDKHELQIHAVRGLTIDEVALIAGGLARGCTTVERLLPTLDLNAFKQQHRQPPFVRDEHWRADFNALPTADFVDVAALDLKRGIAEFVCRRAVIEEVPQHHAAFIDLVLLHDLKHNRPLRLFVRRSGYFLE